MLIRKGSLLVHPTTKERIEVLYLRGKGGQNLWVRKVSADRRSESEKYMTRKEIKAEGFVQLRRVI